MLYDLNNSEATRGCNSTVAYIEDCDVQYQDGGQYANNKCEYCCKGNLCNDPELTEAHCRELQDSGVSAPEVRVWLFPVALVALMSWY